jgi:putative SOS response-associated peptidase YedK
VKEGETTNDLFAFLTTEPNSEVGAIHPRAMPVILTTPPSWRLDDGVIRRNPEAQRPLLDGTLKFVAPGVKKDGTEPSAR